MDVLILIPPSMALLAFLALWRGYLTRRGAISAVVVGTAVSAAGLSLFALLALFFLSSSALTKLKSDMKRAMGLKDVGGRSLRQVAGVGSPIAVFALLYLATGRVEFLTAAVVAVAVATADTWASEVGVAYGGRPRYILAPWRSVEPGVSGGVTAVGTAAAVAGASFIAVSSWVLQLPVPVWKVLLFGYVGELLDSLLGALLQRKYICAGGVFETPRAGCVERGVLNNESVNFVSGFAAGSMAALV